jgi:hypothetical protein
MKSNLMLLATAAMLVATNAQAGFLSPESQRCASPRPLGIFKPRNAADNTVSSNCDVAANRKPDPVQTVELPYRPVGAPGSLIGVPNDTVSPLVQKEIDAATKQTAPLPPITRDPQLLQYLPEGYFDLVRVIAAFNRLARVEPSYVQLPTLEGIKVGSRIPVPAPGGARWVPVIQPGPLSNAGFRVLADRLRCLSSPLVETIDGINVCKIEDGPDV